MHKNFTHYLYWGLMRIRKRRPGLRWICSQPTFLLGHTPLLKSYNQLTISAHWAWRNSKQRNTACRDVRTSLVGLHPHSQSSRPTPRRCWANLQQEHQLWTSWIACWTQLPKAPKPHFLCFPNPKYVMDIRIRGWSRAPCMTPGSRLYPSISFQCKGLRAEDLLDGCHTPF